ncbi:GntR family transcriptional regulator [Methylobacterium variabile]|jgi:DNA-binding GntR family transcriptional regulator|uniref:GntR family transcriptional regulator n=1 Tax=Methylobacterium variabile TaxID=298794 RepID=A0A0J6SM46_9HYPH|nr:GntR family transcriptional regulator [Methylobacterium variabile]KMO36285.1 GntR family transcriptional regulator [Methylobacterium variabile]
MIEVTTGSAAERVEASLRRSIIALDVLPGTRLSEQEIAARHGVSRQPVREAFIGLSRTRLVEVRPQRGTVVAKISVARLMQARFVREAIETAVARRACEAFDPTSRRRIDDLLDLQAERAAAGDHAGFQRADSLFHAALAEGAGCALAWEAVQDVKAHLDRACQLTLPDAAAMLPLVDQHRAIVAGLDARDPEAAAAAMRHHLSEIVRALPKVEAQYPHLFE